MPALTHYYSILVMFALLLLLAATTDAEYDIDDNTVNVNLKLYALEFTVSATDSQYRAGNKTYSIGLQSGNVSLTLVWSQLKGNDTWDTYFRSLDFGSLGCETVEYLPDDTDTVAESEGNFAMDTVIWKVVYLDDYIWLMQNNTKFISIYTDSTCCKDKGFSAASINFDLSYFTGTYNTGL